ncbi:MULTISPECIES: response regulator transcription factor [Rhodanobacter]|uniref:Response regulator transcription factor n=1 Tax=Rhodanobacter hydrolyticus TaxID=2250595 RepID=A0ABW8JFD1_9GAMM|nr:response regulator transcription factor [Rhodanobacter sp. 7MK24]MBD8882340.1 response regulator transcription factor [Rhodanobacter sp. 7MK24]
MDTSDYLGRILLVEDDEQVALTTQILLERAGYRVDRAAEGVLGLHMAIVDDYDAIVLDVMLPRLDGLSLCSKLRKEARKATPILMLSVRNSTDDKISGLGTGADDYLAKPFESRELEARLLALIRRERRQVFENILIVSDLKLETQTLRLTRGGRELSLSPICLKLLTILMRESPHVVKRRDLERQVWGGVMPDSDTLRSHLYNLRQVIDKPFDLPLLHTIHSAGYRLANLESMR